MSFNITGLDNLQRQLEEASEAFEALNGEIATIQFNPGDASSVETALTEIAQAIDAKVTPYSGNPLVEDVANQLKEKYRTEILRRVDEARSNIGNAMPNQADPAVLKQVENAINDLRRAEYNTFGRHIKKLSRLLHSEELSSFTDILTEGVALEPWLQAGHETQGGMIGSARLEWPTNQREELGLVILLADSFADNPDNAVDFSHTFYYSSNSNITGSLQSMVTQVFIPFARDYIEHVKVSAGSPEMARAPVLKGPAARKVFVVHGHDEGSREAVARFLEKLGFEAIILHEQANRGRTVIEKIEAHGDVGFAVILLTPDDVGGLSGGDAQPRARQNVLLELGYFVGRLGRSRVCALKRGDVEVPSDFGGVVYETFDSSGGWKLALGRELSAAGFEIDWNLIMTS